MWHVLKDQDLKSNIGQYIAHQQVFWKPIS